MASADTTHHHDTRAPTKDGLRILLVEFATTDMFHRAIVFPHVHGRLASLGVSSRWIRFGLPATAAIAEDAPGVTLPPEELAHLEEVARAHDPHYIVFSRLPSRRLADIGGPSKRRVTYIDEGNAPQGQRVDLGGVEVMATTQGSIDYETMFELRANGIDTPPYVREEVLDFGWEAGNELARAIQPLPYVLLGEVCTYNAPLKRNEFFHDVDLGGCVRPGGCSFCRRAPSIEEPSVPFGQALGLSLDAIRDTCPRPSEGLLLVRLVGEQFLDKIEETAEIIVHRGLPPSDFLIEGRADRILRRREQLHRSVALLGAAGHRLSFCLVGIESFCSSTLARYNKGSTGVTNLRAVQALAEAERDGGEAFSFAEYGGFSMISFTPWTTPEELDLDLSVVRLLGIEHITPTIVEARLRLVEGLPLEVTARRDGALVDGYDDPLLDTAGLTFYDAELPWRFLVPEMTAINSLMVRMSSRVPRDFDELTTRIQAARDELTRLGESPLRLAQALLMATLAPGEPTVDDAHLGSRRSPETLLDEAVRALGIDQSRGLSREEYRRRMLERDTPTEPSTSGPLSGGTSSSTTTMAPRPEPTPLDPLPRRGGRARVGVTDLPRSVSPGSEPNYRSTPLPLPTADSGAPPCCIEAAAQTPGRGHEQRFWRHVAARLATEGPAPWELSPLSPLVDHAPCSSTCPASLALARARLADLEAATPGSTASLEALLTRPVLLEHDHPTWAVPLTTFEGDPAAKGYALADDVPLPQALGWLHGGGLMEIRSECLAVRRDGRRVGTLSGRGFVWHPDEVFQEPFWRALVDAKSAVAAVTSWQGSPDDQPAADTTDPETPRDALTALEELLRLLMGKGVGFGGGRITSMTRKSPTRLLVSLARGSQEILLALTEAEPGSPALHTAGGFAISHPPDHPLATAEARALAKAFARKLEHIVVTRLGWRSGSES